MSQVTDYVIANASGATVRADINTTLLAVVSHNSGTAEPSTMYAFMLWVDTTNNLIKLRNAANSAWITLGLSITASNTVDINGGTIDATTVGASSASTGAFTTVATTGNVGVGGTAADPQGFGRSLHVEGDANAAIYIRDTGNSNYGYIGFIGSTNKTSLNSYGGFLSFTTAAGVAAMTIDTSQNVGIGTATPSHQLDVRSSSTSADNFITVGNSDNTKFLGLYGGTSSNALPTIYADSTSTALRFAFADDTAFNGFSENMSLNTTGQILANGLGVTTPTFAFIGDTNTGMTRPTADTLQFVCGGTVKNRISGDGLLFNSLILHSAGSNQSPNPRRAIQIQIIKKGTKEKTKKEIDFYKSNRKNCFVRSSK